VSLKTEKHQLLPIATCAHDLHTRIENQPSNRRWIQGASGTIGDPTMESVDWRAQLQADSRQRIVNK
ncbi:hypothetical protein M8C21_030589, partial [Ambrosia artemisiifolia]